MKKRFFAVLCIFFALLLSVSVNAAEIGYSGELDIESDEPKGSREKETDTPTSSRVTVAGGIYDYKEKKYYYAVGSTEVGMSCPTGLVTTNTVSIDIPEGLDGKIYRDGELSNETAAAVTQPGNYVVLFNESISQQSLKFTIVNKVTGLISGYRIPDGFSVAEAKFNGQPIECAGYVDMTSEGRYDVTVRCKKTGISYPLSVSIDHTAPTLKLEGVVNGRKAGPVDISDIAPDTAISITHEGEKIDYQKVLTKTGKYRIELRDKAGNRTIYEFRIDIYFNFSGIVFLIFVVIGTALLVVYLRIKRKKLRIR